MSDLRTCMGISSMVDIIRYNRLCWFAHLKCMDEEKWPRKILNFKVNGNLPRAAQRKNRLTTLKVTLINCDYQLLWLKIMLNGEMQSNHPDLLRSSILAVREKDVKLDSK